MLCLSVNRDAELDAKWRSVFYTNMLEELFRQ